MSNEVLFTKNLDWLRPFYELAKPHLPRHILWSVYDSYLRENAVARSSGEIAMYGHRGDDWYEISLYSEYWEIKTLEPLVRKRRRLSTIDILSAFAHELAHLKHWLHCPNHKKLECKLLTIFMDHAEESGYLSEEAELA